MRLPAAVLFCSFTFGCLAADQSLTLYNQRFAVVRETITLDLKQGVNQIEFDGATSALEPQSVMLRDASGSGVLQILEQNYRADPVSLEALLVRYEGQVVDFLIRNGDREERVSGKIVRASAPPIQQQPGYPPVAAPQPIVEIDGKLRFGLPGTPLFPGLGAGMILKPVLQWTLQSARSGKVNAELAYVSGGFNWNADYNIIQGDAGSLEIIGWVTMENHSGKQFEDARVKLMAGDVNKVQPGMAGGVIGGVVAGIPGGIGAGQPQVEEKSFDEYHLYTLARPVTLHDKESKQVEFVRAAGVNSDVVYVYDGAKIDANRYRYMNQESIRQDPAYGSDSNPKVWVMREFMNSTANHLGMALPKGRVRFYRRDTDSRLEFTGEDTIDHTPKDEKIRVFTGAAFDLAGERRRTLFQVDYNRRIIDEGFEIKVRNHKKEAAEVRIMEHLYRWSTWEISSESMPHVKTDAQTLEFRIKLQPDEERTVTYLAHYTW